MKRIRTCNLRFVDDSLKKWFYKLGYFIAGHSTYFVVIPVLVAICLTTGIQNYRYEEDAEYLFAPVNAKAKHDRALIQSYFKTNYSYFQLDRYTKKGRLGRVLVTAKDEGEVLRTTVFDEVLRLDAEIRNLTVQYEDRIYTYEDLCAQFDYKCIDNSVLQMSDVMDRIENGTVEVMFPVFVHPDTFAAIETAAGLGGVVLNKGDGESIVNSSKAVGLVYLIRDSNIWEDTRGYMWEKKFLQLMTNFESDEIDVFYFASRTIEEELEKNTDTISGEFTITIFIMVSFSVITCMMSDWVRSKPLVGLLGVISSVIATLAAFGLVMYLGMPFIGINMAAPFLILGIGMDDSFVMLAAWRRTRVQDDVRIRMAETFSGAAVSITITSVTDVLSFWVGAFTNFKSVQIFSIYTGTAVVMLYIYHITFFGACMAISGFREAQNRHALLGIRVKPKSEAHNHSLLYRVLCAGGISTTKPYEVEDNKDHAVMLFCRNVIAKNLNKVFFKVLVLLVFALYISVALWGLITHSKEGLERSRLSREDSYSVAYYNVEEKYFRRYPYRVQVVISGDYNYSDPKIRDEVESVISQMENTTYVAESLFTDSWLREFMPLVESNKLWYDINIDTEEDFIYNLEDLFLNSPSNPFYQDVVFNENRTRIIATRYVLQITNLGFIHEDTWMMQELRDICDRSFLNVTVFQPFFIFFDQFLVVADTTINAVVVAGVIMILVSLVFIPNPCCAIWVGFSIISIEVGVMGYMSLWGVSFDAISMINLIMCIGFSVDFSAHISYAYLSAKVNTPAERVEAALHDLGMPILQGSVSTVLGIIALSFAPSYIFVTFFKTIFLVMFFGACHGLFLLPVLLSLFGPASCSSKHHHEKDDDKERADPDPQLGASNYGFDYGIDLVAMPVEGGTSNGRISVVGTPAFDLTTPRTESGADSGERHTIQRQISPESDKDEGIVTSGDSSQQSSIGKTQGERFSQEAAVQRCRQLETPLKRRHPKRRHSVATETQRSPLPLFPFSPHRPAYRAQLSEFFPRESLSALPPLQTNIHNGGAEQSKREKRSSSSNRSSKHKPPATGGPKSRKA